MQFENSIEYALKLDEKDPLKDFRNQFYIPMLHGKEAIYFAGNSLGLQPKTAQDSVLNEMENWANYGVEAHFHGRNPWINFSESVSKKLQPLLGAHPQEIVVMNQLTINLHLLLTTFYRPDEKRFKIICEANTFPSDLYAMIFHLNLFGHSANDALILVKPRPGEFLLHEQDITECIRENGNEVALVFFGGINYITGQVFNMKSIAAAAHQAGAPCGFDLAHAIGNIPLNIHDWDVDFAIWCSYKYLNAGPGAVAGAFINERFISDKSLPRLAGWWGTNKHERFQFKNQFNPIPSAEGWQVSNPSVLNLAVLNSSLDIFAKAGFENAVEKSKKLSAYLLYVLNDINKNIANNFEIITPQNEEDHGCQVSIAFEENGREIFDSLNQKSVIADWREPVIRFAPVPLYNSFTEIFQLGQILKELLSEDEIEK